MRRLLLAALVILAATALAGCKMNIDMTTVVQPGGEMDQEMLIKMEGFGDLTQGEVPPEGIAQSEDGWETEAWTEGEALFMRSTKRVQPGDPMFPPGQVDDETDQPEVALEIEDIPEGREYRMTILAKASDDSSVAPPPTTDDMDPETRAMVEEMAKMVAQMFQVTWTISLPGEVVETNADIPTASGGIWMFTMDKAQETREMRVVTRVYNE